MRYIPGSNLRDIIKAGPLEVGRVARITTQVAAALEEAHDRGLVHRDVKPGNILINQEGAGERAYLTDFGVTKQLGAGGDLTRTGGWVGTVDYVAPEQVRGGEIDSRADVYALGCVVYEMLTGRIPYPRDSDPAKLWAHVSDPPALPRTERPELAPAFDDVIARATAKNPEERYATAGELARAVDQAVAFHEAEQTREADAATRLSAGEDPQAAYETRLSHSQAGLGEDAAATGAPPPPATGPAVGTGAAGAGAGAAAASAGAPGRAEAPPGRAAPPAPPGATAGPNGDGDGASPRRRLMVAGGLLALCAVVVVAVLASGTLFGGGGGLERQTDLGPVPTNKVDGNGDAKLVLDGEEAKVTVNAEGLPDGEHLMHIHADGRDRCPSAGAARRHNGHLAISGRDGIPDYGRPLTSLTTSGDTTVQSAFATGARYKSGSAFDYERTIDVGGSMAQRIRQGEGVIVVHGIDWDRDGKYGAVLQGRRIPKDELSGELTAPALCGPLVPKTQTSSGGGKEVFVASFAPEQEEPADRLYCPLHARGGGLSQPLS
jgi:hypothetical protein